MANGEDWRDWMDKAVACPAELPFGTRIIIGEKEWTCCDRGGKIVKEGNAFWIDQLTETPQYAYGELVEAVVFIP